MDPNHSLLRRQLKRHLRGADVPMDALTPLLEAVDAAYADFDAGRRRLERALELSSREIFQANCEMRGVLQSLPDMLLRVDAENQITRLNQTSADGVPALLRGGDDAGADEHAKIRRQFRDAARMVRETNQSVSFEYQDSASGSELLYEARLLPFVDEDTLAIVRDITQRRILEAQLAQAQKLESIGHLAAGIAHEINTPVQYLGDNTRFLRDSFQDLQGVLEAFNVLLEAAATSPVAPEVIQAARDAVEDADVEYLLGEIPTAITQSLEGVARVAQLVGAMKDFSHPGAVEKTAVDLNRGIDSTITVARNEWKYVADLTTDFDADLPLVHCLPSEVNQVILNMVVNAAHAIADAVGETGAKGLITVVTRRDGDWAEIRISDTGAGIPDHVKNKIFDPFFTTKSVGKGTGQGLAISHSVIVDKHGGTIGVETELGQGTTFLIRLPIHPIEEGFTADALRLAA
ncbi:hypothetical protein CCAX7_18300 [Capsulimonas corticalis]|uniref:histidine kinase n=1 Tax=Capsulimonas corticalis TaxID=2219043 RepID=A0A402D5E1_9BACT|nr:ATP-binding protein [Capsulimonas corticalis]BDI29779.1 hypothetical protein CCAX7_18300 [Capsulimonas corticalis]